MRYAKKNKFALLIMLLVFVYFITNYKVINWLKSAVNTGFGSSTTIVQNGYEYTQGKTASGRSTGSFTGGGRSSK